MKSFTSRLLDVITKDMGDSKEQELRSIVNMWKIDPCYDLSDHSSGDANETQMLRLIQDAYELENEVKILREDIKQLDTIKRVFKGLL